MDIFFFIGLIIVFCAIMEIAYFLSYCTRVAKDKFTFSVLRIKHFIAFIFYTVLLAVLCNFIITMVEMIAITSIPMLLYSQHCLLLVDFPKSVVGQIYLQLVTVL